VALASVRKNHGNRIGFSLVKLGFMQETELTRTLARQYRVPAVDLDRVTVDPRILKLVPADQAMKHLVLPLRRVGRVLTVAMANPTDASAIDTLKFLTRHDIEPVIVGEYTLRKHLERYYQVKEDDNLNQLLEQIEGADFEVVDEREEEVSVAALQAQIDDAPVVRLINGLLLDAIERVFRHPHRAVREGAAHPLPDRWRAAGCDEAAAQDAAGADLARQDPVAAEHRGATVAAGRPDQAPHQAQGCRFPGVDAAGDLR
jgi:hypothetical protein